MRVSNQQKRIVLMTLNEASMHFNEMTLYRYKGYICLYYRSLTKTNDGVSIFYMKCIRTNISLVWKLF